jgi:hypothetical protein
MNNIDVRKNYLQLRQSIPDHIKIVLASKKQSSARVKEAIEAGADIIGENYVQEAENKKSKLKSVAKKVNWHMIGHLQRNKAKKAVEIFDMIESVDSLKLAKEIDKRCSQMNKVMPVLIEINIGSEGQKTGIYPEDALDFVKKIKDYANIKIKGLMTMGPRFGDPENARPYFKKTKEIFDKIKNENIENVEMEYLSMGMSNSYHIAIEEGSNMIRPGSIIFGRRQRG